MTLHLALRSERQAVPDVPVIYFVEPTEENIARIVADYRAGLYSFMHVNFSSCISSKLLERFASDISRPPVGASPPVVSSQISRVIDRYCSFVSLSSNMYSLNFKSTYASMHKSSVTEAEIESSIDQIALGLLSLLITSVRQVPIIRAPLNEAAGMVAERLHDRLAELVSGPSSSDLFPPSAGAVSMDPSHAQRPLLIILDRGMDLRPMVEHNWSYQGLMHDVLNMHLNKVSIPKENKVYDIDVSDGFWKKVSHLAFPEAATAVNEHVNEFQKMRQHVVTGDTAATAAMTALPQVTEMKKMVDMHTSIATTLLNEIKKRSTDKFVEVENDTNVTMFMNEIVPSPNMSMIDKIRTAIVLILKKPDAFPPAKIDQLIDSLTSPTDPSNHLINAIRYIKYVQSLRNVSSATHSTSAAPSSTVVLPGMLGGLAEKVKARSETLIATGIKNLKNILPLNDNYMFTNLVLQLADQIANPVTDSFSYFDPKSTSGGRQTAVRVRGSFRQVIVCVVGGGSISEYENMAQGLAGRSVIYGATDWPTGESFVSDISALS